KGDLVKRRWVSRAVAEVDRPGQRAEVAVGVIGEAGEEAADPADAHAEDEREDVNVAGAVADAQAFLGQLDAGPPAEQPADDGLAAEDDGEVAALGPVVL